MVSQRHKLTSDDKNVVLKLISNDFTHTDVEKYVGVSTVGYILPVLNELS